GIAQTRRGSLSPTADPRSLSRFGRAGCPHLRLQESREHYRRDQSHFVGRELRGVAATPALLECNRYSECTGHIALARRSRPEFAACPNQKFACAHLFSTRTNLCQPGGWNLLRRSHFSNRTTDQAERLQTFKGSNSAGMANATRNPAAPGERAEPVQILRTPAFADQI